MFGVTVDTGNPSRAATGITASNERPSTRVICIPGMVDSSPIFVGGCLHRHEDLWEDARLDRNGHLLWTYTPPGIDGWEGSAQITKGSPAATRRGARLRRSLTASPQAELADARRRPAAAGGHHHARSDPREARDGAQHLGAACARNHRRLHRRRAALPGSRCLDRPGQRSDRPRLERPLLGPARDYRAGQLPDSGRGDLGPGRRGGRARNGPDPGRDGERAVRGKTAWGDSVLELSPDAGEPVGELVAAEPGGSTRRRRPLLDRAGARARCRRTPYGIQGGRMCSCGLIEIEPDAGGADAPLPGRAVDVHGAGRPGAGTCSSRRPRARPPTA